MYRLLNCNECLFERCTSSYARHGFSLSGMPCSGNVLYRCSEKETGHQTGSTGDELTEGRSSDHHMRFSHSNLYDMCLVNNSWLEARDRYFPDGSDPKHNTTAAHTVFWNTEGVQNKYYPELDFAVWSLQARYGYVIGTQGAACQVRTNGWYPERAGICDPPDHIEGVGQGASLTPSSLYEDQLIRRLEQFH